MVKATDFKFDMRVPSASPDMIHYKFLHLDYYSIKIHLADIRTLTSVLIRTIIKIIIIITMTIFIVLSSQQSHCESSLGSRDKYRSGAKWPPTFGRSQPASVAGLIEAASKLYSPLPFIVITHSARKVILILPSHGG